MSSITAYSESATENQVAQSQKGSDEIDFIELCKQLWEGRLAIVVSTLICTAIATVYVLSAQEWWTASVKYIGPNATANQALKTQLIKYEPVMGRTLEHYAESEKLLFAFNQLVRQLDVKKSFLKSDPIFLGYLEEQGIELGSVKATEELKSWSAKISFISPNPLKNDDIEYELKLTSVTSDGAVQMLSRYIDYVKNMLLNQLERQIINDLNSKSNQLSQLIEMKTSNALSGLSVKLEQYKVALAIANGAQIEKPVENFNIGSQFRADLGSKAIASAVNELSQVKDVTILDPSIVRDQYNYSLLENNTFNLPSDTEFMSFTSSLEAPIARDKPKIALVILLGVLFGGVIGVLCVMLRGALVLSK